MHFCYIDESGGFEAPNQHRNAAPLMVIAGLIVSAEALAPLTADLLDLKKSFYPNKKQLYLDYLLDEIKGSDLRRRVRAGNRRQRQHALTVLDGVIDLIKKHRMRLIGRIWVKEPTESLAPAPTYTYAIQDIARHFNHFLEANDSQGLILCDSRDHNQDVKVSHSVFTRKHKATGDELPRILESVLFGRSDNHAGLQFADLVASALLFPIAARAYCAEHSAGGPHVHPRFDVLRDRYCSHLSNLRYVYKTGDGRTVGGVTVSDRLNNQPSGLLFSERQSTRPIS